MAIIKTKFNRGIEGATNIVDAGTEGTKVASGTTAERGSTTGQWRFNSTTGFFEGRGASEFSTLEPSPTVSSVNDTEVDSGAGGNQTIVITGTNFSSGAVASFVGSSASFNASTTTIDSATQITAVAPKSSFLNAQEPYKVKVTSSSGLSGTSATGLINVDNVPSWQTASGSLGTVDEGANANFSVSATDPDGDTVAYAIQSGSIPAGTTLNTSTGAITGTASAVSSDTTSTFTLRATANSKTTDREFSIITADEGILGSAEFYIDPSNSSSWSGSGSSLTNITNYGSKSGSTTNLNLNNGTVNTASGITYIQHNSSGTAPSSTIGNISGNLTNYTIAFFLKVSNLNGNADTGIFMYGNKTQNQAIGGNLYSGGTNQIAHYNYSNDTTFNQSASYNWLNWNFYVFRKVSGTKQFWLNNTQITNTATATNNATSLPSNSTFDYGGRNAPGEYDNWNTQLGFCGIWSSAISDAEQTFLYNKFKGDYGL
jgi:hypothetical protein